MEIIETCATLQDYKDLGLEPEVYDSSDGECSDTDDEGEKEKLNVVINQDVISTAVYINTSIPPPALYTYNQGSSLAINQEINDIVKQSINLKTQKVITVCVNNVVMVIPTNKSISSQLASHLWLPSRPLSLHNKFPFQDQFNEMLPPINRKEIFGIFSAFFTKHNISKPQTSKNYLNFSEKSNIRESDNTRGLYHFTDFTLLVVQNGKIIDYAIHGYLSNINLLAKHYNINKIYYNARPDDALDCFVRYPHQPFYEILNRKSYRIMANTNNVIPPTFCVRNNTFCSFCSGLKILSSYLAPPKPNIPVVRQRIVYPYAQNQMDVNPFRARRFLKRLGNNNNLHAIPRLRMVPYFGPRVHHMRNNNVNYRC